MFEDNKKVQRKLNMIIEDSEIMIPKSFLLI